MCYNKSAYLIEVVSVLTKEMGIQENALVLPAKGDFGLFGVATASGDIHDAIDENESEGLTSIFHNLCAKLKDTRANVK